VRLVPDTNTVVSSAALLLELESVLNRPKFQPILEAAKVAPAYLMQRYGSMTQLVVPKSISRAVRDVDDDVVLGTAMAAEADVIVTGDQDLLVLNPWKGIRILDSSQTIEALVAKKA
jgi:putative PIN family toxin of toxin-antitoxin system